MLLDDLMPRFDVVERHGTRVRAEPAVVYAAIREADLGSAGVARALLAVRAAPAALAALVRSPRAAASDVRKHASQRSVRLADFERVGFQVVAEHAPEEIVIGLLGRFWTSGGDLCADVTADHFRRGPPKGQALAGWNFTVRSVGAGESELRTETRVWCAPDALLKFRLYWLVVRPGSGLIRRAMLQAIRRHAERRATPS